MPANNRSVSAGLCARLLVSGHRTARILEDALGASGPSAGEGVLLIVLSDGRLTMSGVMGELSIKASTATSLVRRLEGAGLVRRVPNPADGRSVIVELTQQGEETSARVRETFAAVDQRLASTLGRDAVRMLDALFDALD